MNIVANPPPAAETTYDFIGLTEEQVRIIRVALGTTSPKKFRDRGTSAATAQALITQLKETGVTYVLKGMYPR